MALPVAPISQQETERKAVELLDAFYRSFFTGTEVTVANAPITLPVCDYQFGVGTPPQHAEKPSIHTVFSDWMERSSFDAGGRRVFVDLVMQIYVRVGTLEGPQLKSDHIARRVADAVKQIFQSEEYLLAQKGIHHARVKKPPSPLPFEGMAVRMLVVSAQIQYLAAI